MGESRELPVHMHSCPLTLFRPIEAVAGQASRCVGIRKARTEVRNVPLYLPGSPEVRCRGAWCIRVQFLKCSLQIVNRPYDNLTDAAVASAAVFMPHPFPNVGFNFIETPVCIQVADVIG